MIKIQKFKINNKRLSFIFALLVFSITVWFVYSIVMELKKEEYRKIENYAKALELISSSDYMDSKTQEFLFKIIEDNKTIPVALVDEKGVISDTKNINNSITDDSIKLKKFVNDMKKPSQAIEIELISSKNYIYFKNSKLLNKLQYFPVVLSALVITFISFSYWYFKTTKENEKSLLWAGMAKETAHQIGTPLSSLIGWLELLKLENIEESTIIEIEKDINRLKDITERFSKIGSIAELSKTNVVDVTRQTVSYISKRVSKKVEVNFNSDVEECILNLNTPLFSWVIENLMKNAVDAMLNEGVLDVSIYSKNKFLEIDVKDTGSGIPIGLQKKIFKPGFSTKKRGWGLGLSLAKRIIEDYHKGKIYVAKSSKEHGTEFKILLRKEL